MYAGNLLQLEVFFIFFKIVCKIVAHPSSNSTFHVLVTTDGAAVVFHILLSRRSQGTNLLVNYSVN